MQEKVFTKYKYRFYKIFKNIDQIYKKHLYMKKIHSTNEEFVLYWNPIGPNIHTFLNIVNSFLNIVYFSKLLLLLILEKGQALQKAKAQKEAVKQHTSPKNQTKTIVN